MGPAAARMTCVRWVLFCFVFKCNFVTDTPTCECVRVRRRGKKEEKKRERREIKGRRPGRSGRDVCSGGKEKKGTETQSGAKIMSVTASVLLKETRRGGTEEEEEGGAQAAS